MLRHAKKQTKVPAKEVNELRAIQFDVSETKRIKNINLFNDVAEINLIKTWDDRYRLDAIQLQERLICCNDIKDIVFEKIEELTTGKEYLEFRKAGLKSVPRALSKLKKITDRKRELNLDISSSL